MGLVESETEDLKLIEELLSWMHKNKKDYTNTFRTLSKENHGLFKDEEGKSWFKKYQKRLNREKINTTKRKKIMNQNNPKFILRNYLAQKVIEEAEKGNYVELKKLIEILKKPFDENRDYEDYANEPPEWGRKLEISCSS